MKKAFTLIELVFVIVILGILAAVAIPRLIGTRDDAKASAMAQNITSGATEIAAYATAHGAINSDLTVMSGGMKSLVVNGATLDTTAQKVTIPFGAVSNCMTVQVVTTSTTDTLTLTAGNAGSDIQCSRLQQLIDTSIYPMILRGGSVVL